MWSLRLCPRLTTGSVRSLTHSACSGLLDSSVGLTEEQRLLQQTATRFALTQLRPNAREWDDKHYFPVKEMRSAAQLGFAALYTPVEHGGSGLGRLDTSIVIEALAQGQSAFTVFTQHLFVRSPSFLCWFDSGCVGTAAFLSIHNMCTWMVSTFGNDQQRSKFLPSLVSMDQLASYCLTEPGSGSDAASLSTTAKQQGTFAVQSWRVFLHTHSTCAMSRR
jgi:isobutyryl-CoA dehydrogenase